MATRALSATNAAHTGTTMPPLWKESLWPLELATLYASPVYYGAGVPRGDRSAVVVVPGFMCTDALLYPLYLWLGRIGYRPYFSGIGMNAECPGRLAGRLAGTVERAHRETGCPVRIVGHSLGGILGRHVALERPELVSQLVYLGSPLQAVHAHPAVVAAAVAVQATRALLLADHQACLTDSCPCGFTRDVARALPGHLQHSAIYTRADGVVDWHDSRETDPNLNHEVGGTHIGLVFNPRAYRALGEVLARPHRPTARHAHRIPARAA